MEVVDNRSTTVNVVDLHYGKFRSRADMPTFRLSLGGRDEGRRRDAGSGNTWARHGVLSMYSHLSCINKRVE